MKRLYRYHFYLLRNGDFTELCMYVDAPNRITARFMAEEYVKICFDDVTSLCFAFRDNSPVKFRTGGAFYLGCN